MEIKIFEKQEFGAIRTFTDNSGKLWFCGSDVAKGLGYARPSKAIIDHCKGVLKRDTPTNGGIQSLSYISEGDVYRLIAHSKLPSAERFESWVFDEIVPSVIKTGGYNADATMQSVVQTLATMQRVLEAQQEINKKLLSQLQTPPTVPDEPEQLAFNEHLPYPPLNQKRGQRIDAKRVGRRPVRWFNIRLYNSLYNAYPKPLRELEKDVGVCGVTLRAWRNGENRPNINNARKLAAVLGVDKEDLFLE